MRDFLLLMLGVLLIIIGLAGLWFFTYYAPYKGWR